MPRMVRQHSDAGFTLIELIFVLAILVLAYGLVAPAISGLFDRPRLDGAVREMVASLREARATAITRYRDIRFSISPDHRSWRFDGRAGAVDDGVDLSLEIPSEGRRSNDAPSIVFFPDGGSTGGRIVIRSGDNFRTVAVEWLTGQIHAIRE